MIDENPSPESPGALKPFVLLGSVFFIVAPSTSADSLHHEAGRGDVEAIEDLVAAGADASDEGAPAIPSLDEERRLELIRELETRVLLVSSEEDERLLGLSREERRLIQMGLSSAGHDPGPVDGIMGSRTRGAIGRWQGSRGMLETGYLDADAAKELLGMGKREASRLQAEREEREAAERRERNPSRSSTQGLKRLDGTT